MSEYLGTALVVQHNGTALPQVTSCTISGASSFPRVNTTHAGDTQQQYVDDLPDEAVTTITIEGLHPAGTASVLSLLSEGDSGSVVVMPEGTASNQRKRTASTSRITQKDEGGNFRAAWPYTLTYTFNGEMVEGTN